VLDIEQYYHVFEAMEANGLVLNLHGEMLSSPPAAFAKADGTAAVTVLNAERIFLPQLYKLHAAFPKLAIVLEHISTREGLDAVRRCGPTVDCPRKDLTQNMKVSEGQGKRQGIWTLANVNRRWRAPSQRTICG
jgi:dihydroorotase